MSVDAPPRQPIPWRLVLAAAAAAAVVGTVGDMAIPDGGWFSLVCAGAAAVFVGIAARRRGYGIPAAGLAVLTAVATACLWVPVFMLALLIALVAAPFGDTGEPWYDYLALPFAPLLLLVQVLALFLRNVRVRWALLVTCTLAIAAMFVYVVSLDVEGEGANIGAGVLMLWLIVAVALDVAGGLGEALRAVVRRSASRGSAR